MNVRVCDVCLMDHGTTTITTRYLTVRGKKELRLDLCSVHMGEIQSKFPGPVTEEYRKEVWRLRVGK